MKLSIRDLTVKYEGKSVFENLNLDIEEGEFISILGPSGVGKSTLLNIIAGSLEADGGDVIVDGEKIKGFSEHFAYMPQDDLLLPWRTILDNVTLFGELHGNKKNAQKVALESFPVFGLSGYESRFPHELSGGMRQRAAFLRTALCNADILLLDEPFAALDAMTRNEMQDWLVGMRERLARTTVLVTHDVKEAEKMSDKLYLLNGQPARISPYRII